MASSKADRRDRKTLRRVEEFAHSVRWIEQNEEIVLKLWLENISEPESGQTSAIDLQTLRDDLRSILVLLATDVQDSDRIFEAVSEHLNTACVSALYSRLSYLEDAVVEALMKSESTTREVLHLFAEVRARFRNMLTGLLQHNADPYEQLSRFAGSTFCRLDTQGTITYANKQFFQLLERDELERDAVIGEKLASFFLDASREELKTRLQTCEDEVFNIDSLTVLSTREPYPVVRATVIPVMVCGVKAQYIINLSRVPVEYQRLFEKCPTGLITLSLDGNCTYSNASAARIWGVPTLVNRKLSDLFPDEPDKIAEQRINRFSLRQADEYPIEARDLKDRRRSFPVHIAAMPEIRENGEIVGAIALVRETTTDQVAKTITGYLATLLDAKILLGAVALEIDKVVPFDRCSVVVYSKGGNHCRSLFSFERKSQVDTWNVRWYEMTTGMRNFVGRTEIESIGDIFDFLKREDWQRPEDPITPEQLKQIHRSFIRIPLIEKGRVVASMSITKKKLNAFTGQHVEAIKALPLDDVLRVVMHLEERRNLQFRIDLMREIFQHWREQTRVAEVIVHRIQANYEWGNVSFFRVDEKSDMICLLNQYAPDPKSEFPAGYRQDQNTGVLGWVYTHRETAVISDLEHDPKFKNIALRSTGNIRSELCIPVLANNKVCWLLNIEDTRRNAFAVEEVEQLQLIMSEVTNLLEGVLMRHFVDVTLENTSDAVIVIEADGVISKANDATARITGRPRETLIGMNLAEILVTDLPQTNQALQQIVNRERISCAEMVLKHTASKDCNVLVSASPLPEELGGSVIIAKDLTLLHRVKQLEFSASLYHELAVQTKTPLALASSWISALKLEDASHAETCDKVLVQLKKIDLPYDRLALYHDQGDLLPYHPMLIDITELLAAFLEEFPSNELEKLKVIRQDSNSRIEGDIFQLGFCVRSILAYLLRFVSQSQSVTIISCEQGNDVEIDINGSVPPSACEQLADAKLQSDAAIQISLGEPLIKRIVERHRGSFQRSRVDQTVQFSIRLPLHRRSV